MGLDVPGRGGRHRRHRRRRRSTSSRSSPTPARTPSSTARLRLRGQRQELAEALPLPLAARGPASRWQTPTPGARRCGDVAAAGPAAGADGEVAGAGRVDGARKGRPAHAHRRVAAAGARRPRPQRGQGRARSPAWKAASASRPSRDRRPFRLPPGYLGPPINTTEAGRRGRPHGRAMSDFVCGANEADFHFTGVNWGRDLPEPGPNRRRHPQRRRRATFARRLGRAGHPARHRGRPRVPSAPSTRQAMNASFLDETASPRSW